MTSKIENLLRLQIRMEGRLPKIGQAEKELPPIRLPGRRHYADQFSESFYHDDSLNRTTNGRKHFGKVHNNENEECIHRERKHYMPTVHEQPVLREQTNIRGWNHASTHRRSPPATLKTTTQARE